MILVQDIHQVIARREVDFETAYRETAPRLNTDDASFLWFAWAPHGGGEGYEAVTLASFGDPDALARHQERMRYGDLGEWWASVEAMRYTLHSSRATMSLRSTALISSLFQYPSRRLVRK